MIICLSALALQHAGIVSKVYPTSHPMAAVIVPYSTCDLEHPELDKQKKMYEWMVLKKASKSQYFRWHLSEYQKRCFFTLIYSSDCYLS